MLKVRSHSPPRQPLQAQVNTEGEDPHQFPRRPDAASQNRSAGQDSQGKPADPGMVRHDRSPFRVFCWDQLHDRDLPLTLTWPSLPARPVATVARVENIRWCLPRRFLRVAEQEAQAAAAGCFQDSQRGLPEILGAGKMRLHGFPVLSVPSVSARLRGSGKGLTRFVCAIPISNCTMISRLQECRSPQLGKMRFLDVLMDRRGGLGPAVAFGAVKFDCRHRMLAENAFEDDGTIQRPDRIIFHSFDCSCSPASARGQ